MATLAKDAKYSRAEVAEMIGLPQHRRSGGNWTTGYDSWNGEAFIFCNVGTAGRTGHDYANRWVGDQLEWYGKTASNKDQPSIRRMVAGAMPTHVFWRSGDKGRFTYAGIGAAEHVTDSVPVKVRWSFR